MPTLVFNAEEIAPRELKPELYELDGISREAVEAHYKLYEGYVAKRNEILAKLADVDLSAGNQVYSEVRALKVDLTFAIGGVKNHEIYFEHLGGEGGEPGGPIGDLIERDFGSVADWRADLKATGMGGRGWAWTAYDWDGAGSSTTSATPRTATRSGTRRRSWRSTSTSTRTSSTTAPTAPRTSTSSSTTSTGQP